MAIIVIEQGGQQQNSQPAINLQYFITPPGIAKLAQFLLGVVLLFLNKPIFLAIVNYLTFTVSNIWICVYVFSMHQRWTIYPPWIVLEFYYTAGATVLYALATLIGFIFLYWIGSVFALAITIAFGAGTFFLFQDWRTWRSNQGTSSSANDQSVGNK